MSKKLNDFSLHDLLPDNIRLDESMATSINALDIQIKALVDSLSLSLIYPAVDTLPSSVLDLLAWQFDISTIEGWQLDLPLEQKREYIKSAINLHRYKGTPYAIRRGLKVAGWGDAELNEWFEYGGEPYCFRVKVQLWNKSIKDETYVNLYNLVSYYKNARSHIDHLTISGMTSCRVGVATALTERKSCIVYPPHIPNIRYSHDSAACCRVATINRGVIAPKIDNIGCQQIMSHSVLIASKYRLIVGGLNDI